MPVKKRTPAKKKSVKLEMTPKAHFEDKVTKGCARGVLRHMKHNRLTLVNLPVGYGKTNIAVMSAVGVAKMLNCEVQIAVLAPVTKRLDKTFDIALDSAMLYYGVKLSRLRINNQDVGSFAGLLREFDTESDKVAGYPKRKEFMSRVLSKPTIFILDETHLYLRNATSKGSKALKKIMQLAYDESVFVKTIGLTATPTDNSILDTIGYLVANGDYRSKNDFYTKEIINYRHLQKTGMTMSDIDNMILPTDSYQLQVHTFVDINRVLKKLKYIMYKPNAPRDFHIPKNVFHTVPVNLNANSLEQLAFYRKLERDNGFSSPSEKRYYTINTMTSDDNMINRVIDAINSPTVHTPVIFYQTEFQRQAIKSVLESQERPFCEVNGKSHSYFKTDKITPKTAVLVQYQSGSVAFEAKMSDTSLYLGLPDSSVDFEQSLGRNTRRGQKTDIVHNYIFKPLDDENKPIKKFQELWTKINLKVEANRVFNNYFTSEWGVYEK